MKTFNYKFIKDKLGDEFIDAKAQNSGEDDMEDDNNSIVSSCGYNSAAGRND